MPVPTVPPVVEPTTEPVNIVPTIPPVPDYVSVCGADYPDAITNCRTNPTCPNGDGCASELTCFAIPYSSCPETATTISPTIAEPSASFVPTSSRASSEPTFSPSPTFSVTPSHTASNSSSVLLNATAPTQSPIYNNYFCGETYEDAEANCLTNQPCPTGNGCPQNLACFQIFADRCVSSAPTSSPTNSGPQPTDSPTSSKAPSILPTTTVSPTNYRTMGPSNAPIVNEYFCGKDYVEAAANCSPQTACPDGYTCPSGLVCFSGISCPTAAPSPSTGVTLTSLSEGPTSSSQPTMATNGTQTPVASNDRFCGSSLEDALFNCTINIPCPDGTSIPCLSGQTCFPIGQQCATNSSAGSSTLSPVASIMAPPTSYYTVALLTKKRKSSVTPLLHALATLKKNAQWVKRAFNWTKSVPFPRPLLPRLLRHRQTWVA